MTLTAAQRKLAEAGQWLPIDGDSSRAIRELVECNSTGPLRLGYGAWRDLLLGAQFTNGNGDLITAGGRAVKNVAGYDLTKFMVGQFGVFGKIVTVTTRTYKRPTHALLATFEPEVSKLNSLLPTTCRPQWALMNPYSLLCGYLGDEQTIGFYESNLPSCGAKQTARETIDEDIAERERLWTPLRAGPHFRASAPPSKISDFVKTASLENWVADAAFGIIIGSCDLNDAPRLQGAADGVGGSVTIFDASGKPQNFSPDPIVQNTLRRLKYAFDPDGRLEKLPVSES